MTNLHTHDWMPLTNGSICAICGQGGERGNTPRPLLSDDEASVERLAAVNCHLYHDHTANIPCADSLEETRAIIAALRGEG